MENGGTIEFASKDTFLASLGEADIRINLDWLFTISDSAFEADSFPESGTCSKLPLESYFTFYNVLGVSFFLSGDPLLELLSWLEPF